MESRASKNLLRKSTDTRLSKRASYVPLRPALPIIEKISLFRGTAHLYGRDFPTP